MHTRSAALLPVGDRVNPGSPDRDYWLFEPGMVAYVVAKCRPWSNDLAVSDTGKHSYRVYTSHGDCGDAWAIGTTHGVHHDQTLRHQGEFRVVGIARWTADGVTCEGDVPDRKISHHVFK